MLDFSLSTVPVISGAAVAVALVFSIVYDWAMLRALGLELREVPTTINDHARSAVIWLPMVLVGFLGYVVIEGLTLRIERGLTEDEIVATSKNPRKTKRYRDLPYKLIPVAAAMIVLTLIALGERALNHGLVLALALLWMAFAQWLNSTPLIAVRRPFALQLAIVFVPAAFLAFGLAGYVGGRSLLNRPDATHFVRLSNNEDHDIIVGRTFDRVLIAVLPTQRKVVLIPWSEVESIQQIDEIEKWDGLLPTPGPAREDSAPTTGPPRRSPL